LSGIQQGIEFGDLHAQEARILRQASQGGAQGGAGEAGGHRGTHPGGIQRVDGVQVDTDAEAVTAGPEPGQPLLEGLFHRAAPHDLRHIQRPQPQPLQQGLLLRLPGTGAKQQQALRLQVRAIPIDASQWGIGHPQQGGQGHAVNQAGRRTGEVV